MAQHARDRGIPMRGFQYFSSKKRIGRLRFEAATAPLCLPQNITEELLTNALRDVDGGVEWEHTVTDVDAGPDGVRLSVRRPDGSGMTVDADWVIGADGAHSTVRSALGIDFVGDTYPSLFMLGDFRAAGDLCRDEVRYFQSPGGILVIAPLPGNYHRVFVNVPRDTDAASLAMIQQLADLRGPGGIQLSDPQWLTLFQAHRRISASMRAGRCFLIGDAAHVHSVAGGQGLNTGLQDAHNLAWKLAMVVHGTAGEALLSTYHSERHRIAKQVVRNTDVQTRAWLVTAPWKAQVRDMAFGIAERSETVQRHIAATMAGNRLSYSPGKFPSLSGKHRHPGRVGTVFPTDIQAVAGTAPHRFLLLTLGNADHPAESKARRIAENRCDVVQHHHLTVPAPRLLCSSWCYYLIRPDGFVAAHGSAAGLPDIDKTLREITRESAVAGREV
ncbi:2-polyprenyl-6-methoxyphenol hydroxylase-like oxidoreductase [Streptantibioticus cattleyicolor NRRL 8057 = DSM 46488]|uniref:2-polyprenyl-6-methoxyphenol hydroxylase-like oxidoreductase n=2 Tax=Kitasatosporales TaxID=85011 RepID=G8WYI6_STREN|nr:2-polyprenyl-6-methoxyphenol hydroxylase-like oxidoreductase [Streptantibioticus cattleyicolor NRRL 8057 = DSM 46488]